MTAATHPAEQDDEVVPLALLSRALDEVYQLRRALAYEADVVEAHIGYATFPKSRRSVAEGQVERMRHAARGQVDVAYANRSSTSLRFALQRAGASKTLTRGQWEAEHA